MKRKRVWDRDRDDDPLSGLINLFDVWIVVVVGLVFALLQSTARQEVLADRLSEVIPEISPEELIKVPKYRPTQSTLTGKGEKLGTAYRLENGEVVYVPSN